MNRNDETAANLANYFRARFPYVYIQTWEETRACRMIEKIAYSEALIKFKRNLYIWTQTDGLRCQDRNSDIKDTQNPMKALDFVRTCEDNAIFIFKDLHVFLGFGGRPADFALIRKMRDIIPELRESENRKNVVLISPELIIPEDMQKEISVFDFPLPDADEIENKLDSMIQQNELTPNLTETEKKKLSESALGLTLQEAENAFSRAIVHNKGLDANAIKVIFDEKNQVIKKNGILEFIKSDLNINDIGGLENLKNWLNKRNNSWLDSARRYNIPAPKGVLITGVPGCGKVSQQRQ